MHKLPTISRLRSLLGVVTALAALTCPVAALAQEDGAGAVRGSLKVTYVGNSGFLIETENHKVLIDALYRSGTEGWVPIPDAQREVLEGAKPPFDGVDLVLVTHVHRDHFEPLAAANYMMNNPDAILFSTGETIQRLEIAFRDYAKIESRLSGADPPDQAINFKQKGIQVTAFRLPHVEDQSANFAFVVSMDGWKFLHTGDGVGSLPTFRMTGLHKGDVDLAFVPYWYVGDAVTIQAMSNGVKAGQVVLMHMPAADQEDTLLKRFGGREGLLEKARTETPNVMVFEKQMDSRIFR